MESLQKALDLDPSLVKDMQKKYPFIKDEVKKVKAKSEEKRVDHFLNKMKSCIAGFFMDENFVFIYFWFVLKR
jgi:hypothetical protein